MSRNFSRLRVFQLADALVLDVYRLSRTFPLEERYGLQSQLRRASLSIPCNIVEGAARGTNRDDARFLRIACGSATEARYLVSIAGRLDLVDPNEGERLEKRFDELVREREVLCQRVEAARDEE